MTLFPVYRLVGQEPGVISKISVYTDLKTKTQYLERFLKTRAGEALDSTILENDLRRLRTLPPVLEAEASISIEDTSILVSFHVEERYTLLPVGDFGITDDNFWIGGGLMESNLFGRGLYAYGYFQYNIRNTVHLIFRNPYVLSSRWGYEFQLKNLPSVENSFQSGRSYEIDFLNVSLAARYEIRFENELFLGTSYRSENTNYQNNNPFLEPLTNPERRAQEIFLKHEARKLDYHNFYVEGWRNISRLSCLIPYSANSGTILTLQNEFRYYKRFPYKGNLALRTMVGTSTPDWHPYNPFIADSYYNFRGIGYRAYRGNLAAVVNLEYRQTLIENKWGGIQTVLFTDTGIIGLSDGFFRFKLSDDSPGMRYFFGLGCRLILKKVYNAILAIDYGVEINNGNQRGWVIGWGQYF